MLEVLLLKYSNPQRLALANRNSFRCCDTDGVQDGQCKNECDNILQFCLQTSSYKSSTISTSVITGDNLTFSAGQNISIGVSNPLMFTGDAWPSDVSILSRLLHQ